MVSVAVSTVGCTDIHFLEPGVEVTGEYYRNAELSMGPFRVTQPNPTQPMGQPNPWTTLRCGNTPQ